MSTERDTIAEIVAQSGWGEPLNGLQNWQRPGVYEIADALLGVFDITPRKKEERTYSYREDGKLVTVDDVLRGAEDV